MPRKSKQQAGTSSKASRSAAKNNKRSSVSVSRHDTSRRRKAAFELLRQRRQHSTWKNAEKQAGIGRRTAEHLLPRAFFRDERGRLQARGYDRYTRKLKIHTTRPGELRLVRARGSREASLVGTWSNAVKAAGRGDFSLIDAFPRNIFSWLCRTRTQNVSASGRENIGNSETSDGGYRVQLCLLNCPVLKWQCPTLLQIRGRRAFG
jgi:hypothetical protein